MSLHEDVGIPKRMYLFARRLAKMEDTEGGRRLVEWLDRPETRDRVIWVLCPDGSFSKLPKRGSLEGELKAIKEILK